MTLSTDPNPGQDEAESQPVRGLVALEEAFSIPEIDQRQQAPRGPVPLLESVSRRFEERLPDFIEHRLPEMDRYGIERQVLSLTVPGIQADRDVQTAVAHARLANDHLASVVARHPDRFSGFAALPTQDADESVRELVRAVEELGFVGALVNDHTHGRYLDDVSYEPLWEALESLRRPLYIHPGAALDGSWNVLEGHPELSGPTWSWGAATAAHALRLVYGGVFDRHPNATVILGHMGEFLPFQASRLDSRYRTIDLPRPLDRRPSEYLGTNILITTSGVFAPAAYVGAVMAIGAESVMFSVDYPYEETEEAVRALAEAPLTEHDRALIGHGNARRILGL